MLGICGLESKEGGRVAVVGAGGTTTALTDENAFMVATFVAAIIMALSTDFCVLSMGGFGRTLLGCVGILGTEGGDMLILVFTW